MTPHNNAKIGEIAKNVLMPGDPLRAKFIAETFLDNIKLVNSVRNMLAYTGTYKGKEITVMASGMGMPSIGIYSYELFNVYGVENIVRVGSSGSYVDKLDVYDNNKFTLQNRKTCNNGRLVITCNCNNPNNEPGYKPDTVSTDDDMNFVITQDFEIELGGFY